MLTTSPTTPDAATEAPTATTPALVAAPPRRRWALRTAVGILALALIAFAGRNYVHELYRLAHVSPWAVLGIAALYLATRALGADVMSASFAALGHRVGRVEAFYLLILQSYTNMLIPRAGMGMPAAYLKVRRGVPVADFGAVQLLPLFVLETTCVGVAGLASQWALFAWFGRDWHWGVAGLFAATVLGCVAATFGRWPARWGGADRNVVFRFAARLSDAVARLGRRRGLLARACAAHLAVVALRALRIQLCFHAIGVPVNFFAASVASLLSDLMIAISVTPGALGFREAAFVYAARLLRTTGDLALSAALLDRLVVAACNIALAQAGLIRCVRPPQGRADPDASP